MGQLPLGQIKTADENKLPHKIADGQRQRDRDGRAHIRQTGIGVALFLYGAGGDGVLRPMVKGGPPIKGHVK